jgi:hypothetical protein
MINLPIISPEEFFELVEFTRIKRMCLKYGCTTCANHDFMELIQKTIGIETVSKIVDAVTYEEIDKHNINDWYMVMGLLFMRFRKYISMDTPLANRYYEHNRMKTSYRREVSIENQKIHDFEVRRSSQKIEEKQQYLYSREKSSINRERILQDFNLCSMNEKLLIIANDYERLPLYYPLDLDSITLDILEIISLPDLQIMQTRFSTLKKSEWRRFLIKVNTVIESKI